LPHGSERITEPGRRSGEVKIFAGGQYSS
jgi:hypothetical protein